MDTAYARVSDGSGEVTKSDTSSVLRDTLSAETFFFYFLFIYLFILDPGPASSLLVSRRLRRSGFFPSAEITFRGSYILRYVPLRCAYSNIIYIYYV